MGWFRRHYGAGPVHLLGLLACFAVAAYAVTRVFDEGGLFGILAWFAGCVILHDLIGWPLYTLADRWLIRVSQRERRGQHTVVPWTNHVRFPVVISAVLLGISFPLIFRLSNAEYIAVTGFNEDVYLDSWFEVTAILFALSAAVYALRVGVALRRRAAHP
jgi:hypothetical protein